MAYNPKKHRRRSIRLKDYDYTEPGWYFVTICTRGHMCLFGQVVDETMHLSPYGGIACSTQCHTHQSPTAVYG